MNKVKFSDIANFTAGQSPKSEFYTSNPINSTPFLQGNRTFGHMYPEIDTYTTKITKLAKKGEVLMSVRAPVGDLNIAPVDVCIGRGLSGICSKTGDNMFLYYALKYNTPNLVKRSNGTTFEAINKDIVNQMEMIMPSDLLTQKKVSSLLSNIDSKIENNNKIIFTLESLAKTIYDYWFLQFEFPNEEGKPYKSSGGKMAWNEELKREIPEGWDAIKFGVIANFVKGKIPSFELSDEKDEINSTPYVTIDVANDTKPMYCNPEKLISLNGETIMVMDGAASGDVYIGNYGILGSTFSKISLNRKDISDALIYMLLNSYNVVYKKANTGSTVPHANTNFIKQMTIAIPKNCSNVSEQFTKLFKKIENCRKENQELASLRDFLLPLLMNGQVTFKEDE